MLLQRARFNSLELCSIVYVYVYTHTHTHTHTGPLCVPHLSYLFISGTLGCFHILTITNGAAMNIGVFSLSLDVYLKVELLDYMVVLF